MNNQKSCPNCGTRFDGRSNQTYYSSRCKTQAFRVSKSQEISRPVVQTSLSAVPIRSGMPRLDKTAVEVERLRLLNAERIKEMEYKELDRQRQFESDQQKRRFEEEREREEWRSETIQPMPVPAIDQSPILRRLDELSNRITLSKDHKQEDSEEDEETDTWGSWETPAIILGGLLLSAILFTGKSQPQPVKPTITPRPSPSSFNPSMPKTPVTDSETNQ